MPRFFMPITVRFSRAMTFERSDRPEPRRLRQITDEIMFELRELSGQEYVPVYAKRKDAIDKLVPASFLPNVNKPPVVDCYAPLAVPPPSSSTAIFRSDTQPYPFYGAASVSWQK